MYMYMYVYIYIYIYIDICTCTAILAQDLSRWVKRATPARTLFRTPPFDFDIIYYHPPH